jgi:hypothetical protein
MKPVVAGYSGIMGAREVRVPSIEWLGLGRRPDYIFMPEQFLHRGQQFGAENHVTWMGDVNG